MTGFVNEILGDDRLWDTGWPETSLTGWPLTYEIANLAILNRTTDKKVYIRTLNSRPYTGPCDPLPRIQMGRITAHNGGTSVNPIAMDTNSATPALQARKRLSNVTEVADTYSMVQLSNTGPNLTRATAWPRFFGQAKWGWDQSEMARWDYNSNQKVTLREGEGLGLFFKSNSGANIFMISVYVKGSGGTFLYNDIVEPLYMGGACFFSLLNPAGSGDVFYVARIQIREVGSDEQPKLDFFKISGILGQPSSAQVVWADTNEATPDIDVKKNCTVVRHGMNNGAIISSPHLRYIMGGEAPYGPNVANGGSVARRGKWSHDMRMSDDDYILKLGPGEGMAVALRNPSAYAYSELICNFAVIGGGTGVYPTVGNVRTGITYGPTGADYTGDVTLPTTSNVRNGISYGSLGTEATGNIVLPSANDARQSVSYGALSVEYTGTIQLPSASTVLNGVSYGANGTEATGTLVPGGGGGGGRHIVISGGWG
jgi:hypothetical protein